MLKVVAGTACVSSYCQEYSGVEKRNNVNLALSGFWFLGRTIVVAKIHPTHNGEQNTKPQASLGSSFSTMFYFCESQSLELGNVPT